MIAYLGGKSRLVKKIVPVIDTIREHYGNGTYFEPFVGGGSIVEAVDKNIGDVFASDVNEYLISMYKEIQKGWIPPTDVSEEMYNHVKNAPEQYDKNVVAFVGFCCSFASKWFGGYARNKNLTNYAKQASNLIIKRSPQIENVNFCQCEFDDITCSNGDVVYCDPPYKGTTVYSGCDVFDYFKFYKWVGDIVDTGAIVLISEYNIQSDDFVCVAEFNHSTRLSNQGDIKNNNRIERIFMHKNTDNIVINFVKNMFDSCS